MGTPPPCVLWDALWAGQAVLAHEDRALRTAPGLQGPLEQSREALTTRSAIFFSPYCIKNARPLNKRHPLPFPAVTSQDKHGTVAL